MPDSHVPGLSILAALLALAVICGAGALHHYRNHHRGNPIVVWVLAIAVAAGIVVPSFIADENGFQEVKAARASWNDSIGGLAADKYGATETGIFETSYFDCPTVNCYGGAVLLDGKVIDATLVLFEGESILVAGDATEMTELKSVN